MTRTGAGWAAHNARMRDQAIERGGSSLATLDPRHRTFAVPSSSTAGRHYDVKVEGAGGFGMVSCNCPAGSSQAPLGSTPCHHGAAGCLRMEDAGLLTWTGEAWMMTDAARGRVVAHHPPIRNACGGCGSEVDDDCLVPVERQAVKVDGSPWHRGCRKAS